MLACVCLNPSFDRTVSLRSFTVGDVNRVLSARQDVAARASMSPLLRADWVLRPASSAARAKTALTRFAASWTASR